MLFNSYVFLFVFLPVTLVGFQLAGRVGRRAVIAWLGVCSLGFYGYWNPRYVVLLLASVALNYVAAALILRKTFPPRAVLIAAVSGNLLALCYYKYLFPMLGLPAVTLPLGISFLRLPRSLTWSTWSRRPPRLSRRRTTCCSSHFFRT